MAAVDQVKGTELEFSLTSILAVNINEILLSIVLANESDPRKLLNEVGGRLTHFTNI